MINREKRTVAGALLEVDIYPVWDDGRRVPDRAPKTRASLEAQKKYNEEQARKKLVRLVNANFGRDDYWMHPTFRPEDAPQDAAEAKRRLTNYLRRVKTARARALAECAEALRGAKAALAAAGTEPSPRAAARQKRAAAYLEAEVKRLKKQKKLLEKPLKYIYCIEKQTYKTGARAGRCNWHFHLFISGGLPDRQMEELWGAGIKVNCDNFQPDKFGPEAAARYMGKDPAGGLRRFGASRNLTKPVVKTRDGRYTRLQIERIATQRAGEAEWWERRYPGYRLQSTNCRWNEHNANWYVSAVLYKEEG